MFNSFFSGNPGNGLELPLCLQEVQLYSDIATNSSFIFFLFSSVKKFSSTSKKKDCNSNKIDKIVYPLFHDLSLLFFSSISKQILPSGKTLGWVKTGFNKRTLGGDSG